VFVADKVGCGVAVELAVAVAAIGQPFRAALIAVMISSIVVSPSPLRSPGHCCAIATCEMANSQNTAAKYRSLLQRIEFSNRCNAE
jgi:hypothetical protein